jgi:hypothetical protein
MNGRAIPLSPSRRLIGDLLHFAAGVPTVPVQREMNIAPLVEVRRGSADRPPWTAIFAKAFAVVAEEFPELRRAYCKLPWPHLYEYPTSVACILIEQEHGHERAVLGLRITDPAGQSLTEIGGRVRFAARAPINRIKQFRQALTLCRLPRILRRLLWWLGLNIGRHRANFFGTFAVTSYSSLGAESLHPLSPLTCTLNYGVIRTDGSVNVRIIYDHRVLDGATVARALARLDDVLNTTLRTELLQENLHYHDVA